MNKYHFFSFCCLFLVFSLENSFAQTTNYEKLFPNDFPRVIAFLKKNQGTIRKEMEKYQLPVQVIAIAAPELLRYDESKDRIELMGNKLLYRNFGDEYSDFSVGYFQMKPSFIEKMEKTVLSNPNLAAYKSIAAYAQSNESEIRGERLRRLELLTWQLKYLACFYEIVKQTYPLTAQTESYRIKFYATAYNHGYDKGSNSIMQWMTKKSFPRGVGGGSNQYAFSDIAYYFYLNLEKYFR